MIKDRKHKARQEPQWKRVRTGIFIVVIFTLLTGCTAQMNTQNDSSATWPLKFKFYNFNGVCFSTQTCSIRYNNFEFGSEEPSPVLASLDEKAHDEILSAGYGPLPLTLPPAKVSWRSHDETPLSAEVDISEIFKDGLVPHKVPREEVNEAGNLPYTEIILEVDDRTINVYSRTQVPTKHLRDPNNRFSDMRNDAVKVYSRTY